MKKLINILVLFMFLGFLSTPTVYAMFDIEISSAIVLEEEEETHSSKIKFGEKEIEAVLSTHYPYIITLESIFHLHLTSHSIIDDLIIKITSPPPEFI